MADWAYKAVSCSVCYLQSKLLSFKHGGDVFLTFIMTSSFPIINQLFLVNINQTREVASEKMHISCVWNSHIDHVGTSKLPILSFRYNWPVHEV